MCVVVPCTGTLADTADDTTCRLVRHVVMTCMGADVNNMSTILFRLLATAR